MAKQIIFIGSGNVATHLSAALQSAGENILQVYSRSRNNAKKLAQKLNCNFTDDIKKIQTNADIYFICVKDDAIEKIIADLQYYTSGSSIMVHTSGTVPLQVSGLITNGGVFYPMQTFSKQKKADFNNTAIFIEATNNFTEKNLMQLAKALSNNVHKMNSEQRKIVHLSAVFANNFTNYLYTVSETILKKNNLPFDILISLIQETAKKIEHNSPAEMQTGPAKRNDKKVMAEHLKILNGFPEYKKIYSLLSKAIMGHTVVIGPECSGLV